MTTEHPDFKSSRQADASSIVTDLRRQVRNKETLHSGEHNNESPTEEAPFSNLDMLRCALFVPAVQ
jgi:hypothetical protein